MQYSWQSIKETNCISITFGKVNLLKRTELESEMLAYYYSSRNHYSNTILNDDVDLVIVVPITAFAEIKMSYGQFVKSL